MRLWSLALLVASGMSGTAVAEEYSVAYLNVEKTFDSYQRTIEFDKDLAATGSKKEQEHQRMVGELKKLREGLELLSDDAKTTRQRELEEKVRKLQEFERATDAELRRDREQMVRRILQEIDQALQQYAAEHEYDLILNEQALVYKTTQFDITDAFIQWLNKQYKR